MRLRQIVPLVVLVTACSGTAATTTTTTEPPATTSTVPATTTTSPVPTTTTTTVPTGELVLPAATEAMPDTWREVFFIPYGETPDTLGTSLGGDGEGIFWGPEYGAQAPDGSWWFLDTAKFRLAHFSPTGEYLEEVVVPTEMLVNGQYFQWSFPRVMADGTVLAARITGGTHYIRYRDGVLDGFEVPVAAVPRADDGEIIYAMDFETSGLWAVDPTTESADPIDFMRGRDGSRYTVTVSPGTIHIDFPDTATNAMFEFTADEVGGPAYLSIEVMTDEEGTLHFFILGLPEADESLQLAGYAAVSASGELLVLEPMMNPFTTSDPGTPARLGVTPGTTSPTFIHIGTDGVRVYTKD